MISELSAMKKYFLFLILILYFQCLLVAQEVDRTIFKGAGGQLSYGVNFIDVSSLNKDLKKIGLPQFESMQSMVGFGGGIFLNNFYLGGNGTVQFSPSASNEYFNSRLIGAYGMFKGGYTIKKSSKVAIYPTFGLGGGTSVIHLKKGPNYSEDFDEFELQADHELKSSFFLLDLGLNSDFYIGSNQSPGRGIFLGFSAGYIFHPAIGNWEYQDKEFGGLEKFAPSGFYFKLKLGWGIFY